MIFLSLSGIWIFSLGVREYRFLRRQDRLRKSYPRHPWRCDFLDCESELAEVEYKSLANALLGAAGLALSSLPLAFRLKNLQGVDNAEYVIALYALIAIPLALYILYMLFTVKKYGRVNLSLQLFPFYLGETLDVRLKTSRPFGVFSQMLVKLSCIEESAEGPRSDIVFREEFSDTLLLLPTPDYDPRRPLEMAILLPLPPDHLPTRLNSDRPRYWVLEVSTVTPGVNFDVSFKVPVCARPH
jgi:hypothetical protein